MPRKAKPKSQRSTPSTKREPVPHAVAVGRVISGLHGRNAYCPARCVSVLRLSEATGLSMEEVVDAAAGLITKKYAVINHQCRDLEHGGYFLAGPTQVEEYAGFLRERAKGIQGDAKDMDALARRLDIDDEVAR